MWQWPRHWETMANENHSTEGRVHDKKIGKTRHAAGSDRLAESITMKRSKDGDRHDGRSGLLDQSAEKHMLMSNNRDGEGVGRSCMIENHHHEALMVAGHPKGSGHR